MSGVIAWRGALAVGIAAAVGVGLLAGPAAAEEPDALGWWWAGRPSATLPAVISPTPEPPEGGLYVAGGLGGPTGVAALRFELDPEATGATLTLTIAEADGTPIIDACPPTEAWQAAENGGWDHRPEPDCETASVTGTVDADGTEVSFALFSLQRDDGVIDVVLVPGEDPENQSPAGFAVTFEPPGDDAMAATEPTDAEVRPVPPSPEPGPAPPTIPSSPASPDYGYLPPPAAPADPGVAGDRETAAPDVAPSPQPTTFAGGFVESEGFAYSAVLMLPLVLLVSTSYLGWALTRPIVVTRGFRS